RNNLRRSERTVGTAAGAWAHVPPGIDYQPPTDRERGRARRRPESAIRPPPHPLLAPTIPGAFPLLTLLHRLVTQASAPSPTSTPGFCHHRVTRSPIGIVPSSVVLWRVPSRL